MVCADPACNHRGSTNRGLGRPVTGRQRVAGLAVTIQTVHTVGLPEKKRRAPGRSAAARRARPYDHCNSVNSITEFASLTLTVEKHCGGYDLGYLTTRVLTEILPKNRAKRVTCVDNFLATLNSVLEHERRKAKTCRRLAL